MASKANRRRFDFQSVFALVALTLAGALAPMTAKALDVMEPARLVGGWDMSLNDTNRRCHILLRSDSAEQGQALGMPAGCRKAMPILTNVDAWRIEDDRAVGFTDRDGAVVLAFAAQSQDRLVATGPEGETYELAASEPTASIKPQPMDDNDLTIATRPLAAPGFVLAQNAPSGGFRQAPAAAPVQQRAPAQPAGPAVRTTDLAGRYAILRENNKDTGCMLTLDDKGRGPGGSFRAVLAPACRDQGIVIFDPLGWQIDRNRLALTARKGHKAHFERQPDGTWQKDPKEGGKALGFRKL